MAMDSTTSFYADDENVYSRSKDAPMPYTWAKDIERIWYDNGDRVIYGHKDSPISTLYALAAIQRHIESNDGRIHYEKHTRFCPICSFPLLAYLLNRKLLGVHKDPKLYFSDKKGRRIYWKVALHIRPKGQAMLDKAR